MGNGVKEGILAHPHTALLPRCCGDWEWDKIEALLYLFAGGLITPGF